MIADVCHNCGDKLVLKSADPKRKNPRFCSKRECFLALRRMRDRARVSSNFCKNCGDQIYRANGSYCKKQECINIRQRERYAKLKAARKIVKESWNAFNQAVVRGVHGRWMNARDIQCKSCRYFDHCSERVKYGIPVACERWDKRDIELLEINPNKSSIISLLEEGMAL